MSDIPRTQARSSLADDAYAAIRELIVTGRIAPGSRVTVGPIAAQLELSATPVKAALVALERDGMVINRLNRGFFVPEFDVADMYEIYDMRSALDGIAAWRAASAPDHVQRAAPLREHCQTQSTLLRRGDIDGYRTLVAVFHRALWEASHNSRVLKAGEALLDQVRLGVARTVGWRGRSQESIAEHMAIVEAIERGDPEEAEALARLHVQNDRITFTKALPAVEP